MNKHCLFFSFLFLSFFCKAQTQFCLTDEKNNQLIANNPYIATQIELNNQKIFDYLRHNRSLAESPTTTFTLPVVIHVIAPPGALLGSKHNINDWEIMQGLEKINQSFANQGIFESPNGVNMGVSFCLARIDPNGNPTNGINRIESNLVVGNNNCDDYSTSTENEDAIKSLIKWDCDRYINFWLVTDLYFPVNDNCGIGGFAYYPGASCYVDGIVMETRYWNNVNAITVPVHELGHHLNLLHTFAYGCTNNCETQGDRVCDTPPDNSILMTDCENNSCNNDLPDLPDDTYNHMDYSVCKPKRFTLGQKARMVACLETNRAELANNNVCNSITNRDVALLNFTLPNGTCDTKSCPTILVQNNGNQIITKLKITQTLENTGQSVETIWTGTIAPKASIEIILNCLDVGLGVKKLKVNISEVNNLADQFPADNSYNLQNIEFFTAVDLSLQNLDTAICGMDGRLLLKTMNGTAPFYFDVNTIPMQVQISPYFDQLPPKTYQFRVKDAKGCQDSIMVVMPDKCPPCLGGILNHYAAVQEICQNSILKVDENYGFEKGMKVLIHQAQGAILDTNRIQPTFGTLDSLKGAGLWEINEVFDIANGTIQLKFALKNTYSLTDKVQVVTVPYIGSKDVCGIIARKWDGNKGGILALEGENINLLGNIDASGTGFRGGQLDCCTDTVHCGNDKLAAAYNTGEGGQKGEGISTQLTNENNACRGKNTNGGGGGNNHNAGGGGGGNGGLGGFGGKENLTACNFIAQLHTRGEGGQAVSDTLTIGERVFFGGGGGAGDAETYSFNYDVFPGGQGGGFLFIKANTITSVGGRIINNGADVPNAPDAFNGQGGGGGGGTIFLDLMNQTDVEIYAIGGKGGSASTSSVSPKHGPGGGGGGGFVKFKNAAILTNVYVYGNIAGLTDNQSNHDATKGESGQKRAFQTYEVASQLVVYDVVEKYEIKRVNCSNTYEIKIIPKNTSSSLKFAINGGDFQDTPLFSDIKAGNAIVSYLTDCYQTDTLLVLPEYSILKDTLLGETDRHCDKKGEISIEAKGGTSPYLFKINNASWQNTGGFTNLEAGVYTIIVSDSVGCTTQRSVEILNQQVTLAIDIDSSSLINKCDGLPIYIAVSASGSVPYYTYSIDNQSFEGKNIFENISTGVHSIKAKDEHGCFSNPLTFNVLNVTSFFGLDTTLTLCEGEAFYFGGIKYDQTGIYFDTIQNSNTCDTLVAINLMVLDTNVLLRQFDICAYDTIVIDGVNYNAAGIFVQNLLNQWGCDSTITTIINHLETETCKERDCKIYLPNAFSPNSDRNNDFLVLSSSIVQIKELQVFDRWGNLMYQSKGAEFAWNGQNQNGKDLPQGIYIYVIRGICADGSNLVKVRDVLINR
jgi:gliding motility-associated-like protein